MARSEGGGSPLWAVTTERRSQPRKLSGPAALLPRAVDGCVDFGVGRRCSLGRDRTGYRHCASRLDQRQNPQQRDPSQYFNRLVSRGALREDGDSERIREQAERRDQSPSGIYEMAGRHFCEAPPCWRRLKEPPATVIPSCADNEGPHIRSVAQSTCAWRRSPAAGSFAVFAAPDDNVKSGLRTTSGQDQVINRNSCVCMRCGWIGTTRTLKP